MRKRIRLNDEFTELQTPSLLGIDLTRHKVPSNHSVRSKYDKRVAQSNRWYGTNGYGSRLGPAGGRLRNYPLLRRITRVARGTFRPLKPIGNAIVELFPFREVTPTTARSSCAYSPEQHHVGRHGDREHTYQEPRLQRDATARQHIAWDTESPRK